MRPSPEWIAAAKRENTEREYLLILLDLIEEGVLVPFVNIDGIACVQFPTHNAARKRLFN